MLLMGLMIYVFTRGLKFQTYLSVLQNPLDSNIFYMDRKVSRVLYVYISIENKGLLSKSIDLKKQKLIIRTTTGSLIALDFLDNVRDSSNNLIFRPLELRKNILFSLKEPSQSIISEIIDNDKIIEIRLKDTVINKEIKVLKNKCYKVKTIDINFPDSYILEYPC